MVQYRECQAHRFNQPVGKQYTYNKGIFKYSQLELLKLENKQLKARIEIVAKFQQMQRRLIENQLAKSTLKY